MELQFQAPVSDWDIAAEAMRNSDREADQNKISLIVSCNIFAYVWEREAIALGQKELDQLYHCAKRLDSEHKLGLDGVTYPGSWRFFLQPFLENAPTAWKH